jgi:hypothetical protein
MATALLVTTLKPGRSVGQQFNKEIDNIDPERMIRFIESMPDDNLNDPGNFLGFIYRKTLARQR